MELGKGERKQKEMKWKVELGNKEKKRNMDGVSAFEGFLSFFQERLRTRRESLREALLVPFPTKKVRISGEEELKSRQNLDGWVKK
jgi:hypothetical protein